MKKLMSSMLAIAAMASIFSCSTEDILDQETPGTDNNGLVPIKMTAEIGGLTTKAAIKQGDSGALTEALDVFFLRSDGATANWNIALSALSATISTEGKIAFTTPQYYPQDGTKTHLIGYYPVAASTGNNKVTWEINGTQDIIISSIVEGDKNTALAADATPLKFDFKHKLTQLKFKVKIPATETASGETLSSITVKNLKKNAEYDFTSNALLFTGDATNSMTTENPDKSAAISSTTDVSGGTLLVESSTAETSFDVEVKTTVGSGADVTTKTYSGTVKIGAAANTAYDVTLTIAQKQVEGTATIGQWSTGTAEEIIY